MTDRFVDRLQAESLSFQHVRARYRPKSRCLAHAQLISPVFAERRGRVHERQSKRPDGTVPRIARAPELHFFQLSEVGLDVGIAQYQRGHLSRRR